MDRLVPMGRSLVLSRPNGLAPTQIIIGMQRPVRVTQQFTGQEDDVGLAGTQDVFGLSRLGDHADGAGGAVADCL